MILRQRFIPGNFAGAECIPLLGCECCIEEIGEARGGAGQGLGRQTGTSGRKGRSRPAARDDTAAAVEGESLLEKGE